MLKNGNKIPNSQNNGDLLTALNTPNSIAEIKENRANEKRETIFFNESEIDLGIRQKKKFISNIEVESFTGLLTDFARQKGASFIIRGLRAVSDFEYEFQMASANKRLKPDLETVFLTASESQHFVASSLVKEIARYGGDISSFVPIEVSQYMTEAFSDENS